VPDFLNQIAVAPRVTKENSASPLCHDNTFTSLHCAGNAIRVPAPAEYSGDTVF